MLPREVVKLDKYQEVCILAFFIYIHYYYFLFIFVLKRLYWITKFSFMDEHTNDRVSSLRQREHSLEKDRLHVRFDEARGVFKEQCSSDNYSENVQEQKSQSSNRKQYSLKLQLDHSESECERKKLNSIDQDSKDDKSYSSHLSSGSARVDTNSLQNHRFLSRPDTHVKSNKIRPSSEEKNDLASNSALRDDTNDEKEINDTQEDLANDGEVSNDDFNEKLASLDENSRKYYHFFHVCYFLTFLLAVC